MALPADLTVITVTGSYLDPLGNPLSGVVTFVLGQPETDAVGKVTLAAGPYIAPVSNGTFSITLPCTDNANLNPTGFAYLVTEQVGGVNRQNTYQLPHSLGATVDISTLIPVNPPTPYSTVYAIRAQSNTYTGATNDFTGSELLVHDPVNALDALNLEYFNAHAYPAQPWQFNVTAAAYGARGDGQAVVDGAMTVSSNVLACTTSTRFKASDVGKWVMVKGAAAVGVTTLVAQITGYTDSGHVTLSASAATTMSGALVLWATDDTAAFQAAINAGCAYAAGTAVPSTPGAGAGYCQVFVPPAPNGLFYGIAGALVNGGATLGNGQLTLPIPATTGNKIVPDINGVPIGAPIRHWQQTIPNFSGSAIVSFGVFGSISAQATSLNNNGSAALITGPSGAKGYGTSASLFSNMQPCLRNLNIITTHSTYGLGYGAWSFHGCANAFIENVTIGTAGTAAAGDFNNPITFANGFSIGGVMPASGNNDSCQIRNLVVMGGYTFGLYATEHTDIHGGTILYNWAGYCPVGAYGDGGSPSGALHATKATMLSVEGNTWPVALIGAGAGGIGPQIHAVLDTEQVLRQFRDQSSGTALGSAVGEIRLCGDNNAISTANPTGLVILDDTRVPGPASQIALTLGTPVQNTYWRRAKVILAGGTVTAVKVSQLMGGASAPAMTQVWTGALPALPSTLEIPLGPGAWIEVDGTVLPTTNTWILE